MSMKVIVTRQNADGSYDECGMSNRFLASQYKTVQGALRHAATSCWARAAGGKAVRFEFVRDEHITNPHVPPFRTVFREI